MQLCPMPVLPNKAGRIGRKSRSREWLRTCDFPETHKEPSQAKAMDGDVYALLSGYIFFYSDKGTVRYDELIGLRHVIRVLVYGEAAKDVLTSCVCRLAVAAEQTDRHHEGTSDSTEIVDGIFKQLNGTIAQMGRQRRTVGVKLNTEGSIKSI